MYWESQYENNECLWGEKSSILALAAVEYLQKQLCPLILFDLTVKIRQKTTSYSLLFSSSLNPQQRNFIRDLFSPGQSLFLTKGEIKWRTTRLY